MVTWCHCSDAHLGYKQYNLPERLHDFGNAFSNCITLILQEKPDFVIFTGDLFEHYNPNPPELRQAIATLNKLKKPSENGSSIPIYLISGNHDVSPSASKRYGGDILEFLQDLELVHYLADTYEIITKNEDPIALVAGLRYWGKKTPEKLNEFYKKYEKEFERTDIPKILMVHAYTEGTIDKYDISSYGLNLQPFDYIAVGHYHMRWPVEYTNKKNKVFYAGGTEHRTSAEWNYERGFISVRAEQNNGGWSITPRFISYEVREKKAIFQDFKTANAAEIMETTRKLIEENDKADILLKLILNGTLKKGEIQFLNLQRLRSVAQNALYIDIINHITPILTDTKPFKTDEEAYAEIFKNTFNIKEEYLNEYAELMKTIIKIVNDRNFNESCPQILDEFIGKIPIIVEDEESFEKKLVSEKKEKSAKKPVKARKKAKKEELTEEAPKSKKTTRKIKKLDSF